MWPNNVTKKLTSLQFTEETTIVPTCNLILEILMSKI